MADEKVNENENEVKITLTKMQYELLLNTQREQTEAQSRLELVIKGILGAADIGAAKLLHLDGDKRALIICPTETEEKK